MARVIPDTKAEQLSFFAQKSEVWYLNFAAIGLSEEQASALVTASEVANMAATEVATAREALRQKETELDQAMAGLLEQGRACVLSIKSKAMTSPNVYAIAQIPAPSPPSPSPPPAQPQELVAAINADGRVALAWKGRKSASSFYRILRKLNGEAFYSAIGSSGTRRYLDASVPRDAVSASYRVAQVRGAEVSEASNPAEVGFQTLAAAP